MSEEDQNNILKITDQDKEIDEYTSMIHDTNQAYFGNLEDYETVATGECISFKRLNLFQMSLRSVNLHIATQTHLREIDLSFNFLNSFEVLDQLPSLVYLNLSHNRFTCRDIHDTPFKFNTTSFQKLTQLDMSYNTIDLLLDFSNLVQLNQLNLSNNQIKKVHTKFTHQNLLYLILHKNQLTHLDQIQDLPSLEFLDVNENKIEHFGIMPGKQRTLTNTEKLKSLKVTANPLNQNCFDTYKFPLLEFLEMKNTEVLFESIELQISKNFLSLRCLREVDIAENKGLDEFKEAEGTDIKVLLLTVAPNLKQVNEAQINKEDQDAAKQMLSGACINQFKSEIKKLVAKETAEE